MEVPYAFLIISLWTVRYVSVANAENLKQFSSNEETPVLLPKHQQDTVLQQNKTIYTQQGLSQSDGSDFRYHNGEESDLVPSYKTSSTHDITSITTDGIKEQLLSDDATTKRSIFPINDLESLKLLLIRLNEINNLKVAKETVANRTPNTTTTTITSTSEIKPTPTEVVGALPIVNLAASPTENNRAAPVEGSKDSPVQEAAAVKSKGNDEVKENELMAITSTEVPDRAPFISSWVWWILLLALILSLLLTACVIFTFCRHACASTPELPTAEPLCTGRRRQTGAAEGGNSEQMIRLMNMRHSGRKGSCSICPAKPRSKHNNKYFMPYVCDITDCGDVSAPSSASTTFRRG